MRVPPIPRFWGPGMSTTRVPHPRHVFVFVARVGSHVLRSDSLFCSTCILFLVSPGGAPAPNFPAHPFAEKYPPKAHNGLMTFNLSQSVAQ
jgi:hypothetical protein